MMADEIHPGPEVRQEANVEQLVQSLATLHDMERTTVRLISFGRAAVASLRNFLFRVDSSGIYEPRCWAVRALGRIGAQEVLVEFLNADHSCSDPVAQMGEEAVVNTTARALAGTISQEAYAALLRVARWRPLPGAIEVLGEYSRPEVVPVLIRALEDDVARASAEEALSNFGESVGPSLRDAATRKEPAPERESPSSVLRRRAAIRLLADTRTASGFWNDLRALMRDSDFIVRARSCRIGLDCGNETEKTEAALTLVQLLSEADSSTRAEIEDVLVRHYSSVGEIIEDNLKREEGVAARRSLARIVSRAGARPASDSR